MSAQTIGRTPKRRLTNKERAQIARDEQAARLQAFEASRSMIWTKLWAVAQTLVLAKTQCPGFLEEQDFGALPGLSVNVVTNTIGIHGLDDVSIDTLTAEKADYLDRELTFLASEFDAYQRTQQRYARERKVLVELRRSAITKLTEPERVALGVHGKGPDCYAFREPKDLSAEERAILETVMPRD